MLVGRIKTKAGGVLKPRLLREAYVLRVFVVKNSRIIIQRLLVRPGIHHNGTKSQRSH
jgi:hypothetical protein